MRGSVYMYISHSFNKNTNFISCQYLKNKDLPFFKRYKLIYSENVEKKKLNSDIFPRSS